MSKTLYVVSMLAIDQEMGKYRKQSFLGKQYSTKKISFKIKSNQSLKQSISRIAAFWKIYKEDRTKDQTR